MGSENPIQTEEPNVKNRKIGKEMTIAGQFNF
jgi:hypothetical protein